MATQDIEVLQINTQPSVKSLADLKKEIKDLKGQLLSLDQGTEEYNQTLSELGNKMHDLKEVNEQASMTNSDFGTNLGNVSKALAGMSGAVSVVTGTLSLMGVQMGDDTKLMKTLVSAMSITQGLSAIESGYKSMKALGTSIKNAITQQKGFNAAALKNPYIIAGAAVVAAIVAITKALGDQRKVEEQRHQEAMDDLMKELDLRKQIAMEAASYIKDMVDFESRISKMTKEEQDNLRKELEEQKERNNAIIDSTLASEEYKEALDKVTEAENSLAWAEQQAEEAAVGRKGWKKAADERKKVLDAYKEDYEIIRKNIDDAQKENKLIDDKINKLNKAVPAARKASKSISDIKESVKGKDIFDLQMSTVDDYQKKLKILEDYLGAQQTLVDALGKKMNELGGSEKLYMMINKTTNEIEAMPTELAKAVLEYQKAYKVLKDLYDTHEDMIKDEEDRLRLLEEIGIQGTLEDKLTNNTVINLREQIKLLQKEGEIQRENNNIEDQQFWNPNAKNNLNDIEKEAEQQQVLADLKFQVTQHGLDMEYEAQVAYYENLSQLYADDVNKQLEITNTLREIKAQYNYDTLANEEELKNRSLEIAQEERDAKVALVNSYLDAYQSMSSAITGILGSIADTQEQGTREWKNLKIAEAIINTIAGSVSAFMSGVNSGIPAPYNLILAATMATSTLAAGFAEVKKIQDTKVSRTSSSSSARQATVQTIQNTPSNVRTTNPSWNDEEYVGEQLTETSTTVTLVTSDLEALQSNNVNIKNNNSF